MIPSDSEELHVLAGEYVLGVLEPEVMNELAFAAGSNPALSLAIAYWEERLHGLSRLAPRPIRHPKPGRASPSGSPRRPCPRVELGFGTASASGAGRRPWPRPWPPAWRSTSRWRRDRRRCASSPCCIRPQQEPAAWIATAEGQGPAPARRCQPCRAGGPGLRALGDRPAGGAPKALGVVPANGNSRSAFCPMPCRTAPRWPSASSRKRARPPGLPTGPVVFVGRLNAVRP